MNNFEYDREKNIYNIVSIVKLVSLVFCSIVIYNKFFMKYKVSSIKKNFYGDMIPLGLFIFTALLVYWLWSFFSIKMFKYKYIKWIQIIENLLFVLMFSVLIFKSNSYMSEYKFLFLFIIITSTIQLGLKYGMAMAIVSSLIILGMDLIYAPSVSGINLYFENDFILAGVFILTALPLGYYVQIENENLKRKNLQLKALNNELSKKDKERKYVQQILLKNEDCYNLLIQNSRDAIFVHREGNLIFTNESAAKLVGLNSSEELNKKSVLDFTPFKEKDKLEEKFKEIYNKKITMIPFEQKIIGSKGEIIVVQNTSTYFIYEGKATILSILHDMTPEKQVEKLQKDVEKNIELLNESRRFNNLITEFLSNVSHELKTPLNVIFSAVQVLNLNDMREEFLDKRDKYFKVIKQNCYRLMRLINNLLDITKLDSGFLKLNMKNSDIVNVIEDITLSIASYAESKEIDLIFDTNVEEKVIAFDEDKIERIILNLLSNAIKFTKASGKIYVNLMITEDNVKISVKDTGLGIPEDKMKIIFQRFGQVDKTFRRDCEGSGIGLYLVKSFAEMHGGSVQVKSELGVGSEFIVNIPVTVLPQEDSEQESMYKPNIEKINIEFSDISRKI